MLWTQRWIACQSLSGGLKTLTVRANDLHPAGSYAETHVTDNTDGCVWHLEWSDRKAVYRCHTCHGSGWCALHTSTVCTNCCVCIFCSFAGLVAKHMMIYYSLLWREQGTKLRKQLSWLGEQRWQSGCHRRGSNSLPPVLQKSSSHSWKTSVIGGCCRPHTCWVAITEHGKHMQTSMWFFILWKTYLKLNWSILL